MVHVRGARAGASGIIPPSRAGDVTCAGWGEVVVLAAPWISFFFLHRIESRKFANSFLLIKIVVFSFFLSKVKTFASLHRYFLSLSFGFATFVRLSALNQQKQPSAHGRMHRWKAVVSESFHDRRVCMCVKNVILSVATRLITVSWRISTLLLCGGVSVCSDLLYICCCCRITNFSLFLLLCVSLFHSLALSLLLSHSHSRTFSLPLTLCEFRFFCFLFSFVSSW